LVELICFWHEMWRQFSETFWSQLRNDLPDVYAIFDSALQAEVQFARNRFAPLLRPDTPLVAAEFLISSATNAARDDEWLRAHNLTYRQAVETMVAIWARGALRRSKRV
jgi:hypothetical protein